MLGTNSEFYALDEREKQEVIATAVAHVNKPRAGLRRHRGRDDPRGGPPDEDGREAKGSTASRSSRRTSSCPTQQEIFDHYRRIAENTSLPVMLYNNPATCGGVKIDVDTVARLAEIPNILGIKDSSAATCRTPTSTSASCRSGSAS